MSVKDVRTLRRAYRDRAELIMAQYMDAVLCEYDLILQEIFESQGQEVLESKRITNYAVTLLELAFTRTSGEMNVDMVKRLAGVHSNCSSSRCRREIEKIYQERGMACVPPHKKKVPYSKANPAFRKPGMGTCSEDDISI